MDTLITVLLCILLADFITGFAHWFEDTYGDPDWGWGFGEHIVKPNIEHHKDPGLIGRMSTVLSRNFLTVALVLIGLAVGVPFALLAGYSFWHLWPVFLVATLVGMGNEVHTWNHRPHSQNPWLVRFLQDAGIVQSKVQHGKHHRAPYDKYYCTLTNVTNAVLERINFWRGLEWAILVVLGVPVKRGDPKRNGY